MSAIQDLQPYIDTFQAKVRKAKDASGLTLPELTELSGVSYSSVCRTNAGTMSNPLLYNSAAICKTLGLSLDELFGLQKSPENPDELLRRIHCLELEAAQKDGEIARLQAINKIQSDGLRARRPIIYTLLCLCAILSVSLCAYLVVDSKISDAGLIRFGNISVFGWLMIAIVVAASVSIVWSVRHVAKKEKAEADAIPTQRSEE